MRGGLRSFEIGTYLAAKGHHVTAIVPGIDPLTEARHPGLKLKPWIKERIDGVTLLWVNSSSNERAIKLSRILYFLTSSCMQFLASFFVRKPDVLISTSLPPSLLMLAYLLARIRRIPLIVDVRDLPFDYSVATQYMRGGKLIGFLMKIEAAIYNRADFIFTVSKGILQMILGKGVSPEKTSFLPIGYDKLYYEKNIDFGRNIRKELGLNGKFLVLYAGSMGYVVDIMTVLKAAELTSKNENIFYVFAGAGQRLKEYEAFAFKKKLPAIFIGEVPKSDIILLCSTVDVCVYALDDKPIYGTFLGNKVFDYLGTGNPLLFCGPEGDITELLHESLGGICLKPGDFEGLAENILALYENPNKLKLLGKNAQKTVARKYLTQNLMDQLNDIIEKTVRQAAENRL